ncbi:uncharacterized protein LOC142560208 isoform X2 [Dermacentor variabilis]|uniref:uncharacterized protein LOC142560208 isoform X2 n=1 Tax=Dermacentor variabilis TaxID=34621 RepID=UPI003F5C9D11
MLSIKELSAETRLVVLTTRRAEKRSILLYNFCYYDNQTFKSQVQRNGTCELLTCGIDKTNVTVVRCSDPGPGCTRVHNNETIFPHCCEEKCYATSACTLPNGHLLMHGQFFNSTDPCVEYYCNNGNLTITQQCKGANDKKCSVSTPHGMDKAPYPTCCGEIVCPNKRRKRAPRSGGNRKRRQV